MLSAQIDTGQRQVANAFIVTTCNEEFKIPLADLRSIDFLNGSLNIHFESTSVSLLLEEVQTAVYILDNFLTTENSFVMQEEIGFVFSSNYIYINGLKKHSMIEIYSMAGQKVAHLEANGNNLYYDVSSLQNGNYIIFISNKSFKFKLLR